MNTSFLCPIGDTQIVERAQNQYIIYESRDIAINISKSFYVN